MKKLIMIGLPVLILAVGAGLVLTGVVNIPGLSPKKATAKANSAYTEAKDPKIDPKKDPPAKVAEAKPKPPAPKVDATVMIENKPEVGQKKLAKLWNEVEVSALKDMIKDWKETELAAVLIRMDAAKVAELLSALEPKRASALSRELAKQASLVPKLPS